MTELDDRDQANVSFRVTKRWPRDRNFFFKLLKVHITAYTTLCEAEADKLLVQRLAKVSGGRLDDDAGALKRGNLRLGVALAAGYDGASVAHTAARGCGDTCDEGDDGLGVGASQVVLLQILSGLLFGRPANFTDHDNTLGFRVIQEDVKHIDEVGAREGVTAEAYDECLAEANFRRLRNGLVCECAGAGHDADASGLVDALRHDADLAFSGSNDTRAVWPNKARLALRFERLNDANHVVLRNSLRDRHYERDLGLDCLHDRCGGRARGHKNARRGRARLLNGLGDRCKHRLAQMLLARMFRVRPADDLRTVLERLLRVERRLLAGEALVYHLCVLRHQNVAARITVGLANSSGAQGAGRPGSRVLDQLA